MKTDASKTKAELIKELEELRALNSTTVCGRYRQIVEGLPQFIYEIDKTGRLTYANDQALEGFGYTQQDIENGMNVIDIIHDDSKELARANITSIIHGGDDTGAEYMGRRKDGTQMPIMVYSKRYTQNNKVIGLRGVVIDLTSVKTVEEALHTTESYYQTLFENTGTAMSIVRLDSVIKDCNTQFEELSGYSAAEIEGKMKWSDFVDPLELKRMTEYYSQRVNEGHSAPDNYGFTFLARNHIRKQVHLFVRMIPGTDDRVCSLIDITSRLETANALNISKERYQLVAKGANDGVWDWDLTTDAVWYSPRYKAILGYTDEEFPNHADSWKNAVHPDDLDYTIDANMKCINGEVDIFQVEYRMFHKNGSIRWILGRGGSAIDEDGKAIRLAGTHTDITERKRVEQALRESEERYRELVEQASSGIYQCTPEGRFITANTAMAKIMGFNTPEKLVATIKDAGSQLWVNPDDYKVYRQQLEEQGYLNEYEMHVKRSDGSRIWASENVRVVHDDEGNVLYYNGFLQDITSRKMNERVTHALYAISTAVSTTSDLAELYSTIHSIIDEVITAKNFFIALYDNRNDSLEFVYYQDEVDAYFPLNNISDTKKNSLTIQVYRSGSPLFFSKADTDYEEILDKFGIIGTAPAVWMGTPLKLSGRIMGAMVVQDYENPKQYADQDVAFLNAVSEQVAMAIDRKSNEEALTRLNEDLESKVDQRTAELKSRSAELENANERLMKLDEIKSSLVSSVSHELRTPLTSIRGFAKLCSRDFERHFKSLGTTDMLLKKGDRIGCNLDIIDTEGERLTRLINDFLDINRIESGKASWHDHPLNPCDIILKAAKTVSSIFKGANKDVELITDLPRSSNLIIVDPDKIQQVLINLLNNAYKFTHTGTVSISLKDEPDCMTFSITDTGTGIPESEIPYIFDKFHKSRIGDTIRHEEKGTGLGLAICKEIVEHYGGAIWVDSDYGKGSTFSFALPPAPKIESIC